MDKELRCLFSKQHIITRGITLKNHVKIIDDGEKKYVIKKRNKRIEDIYQYLVSRSFEYIPSLLFQTDHYDVYEYIEDANICNEERANDIFKLVSVLHSKTTFYKDIDDDTYKELYENIMNQIDYLFHYYDDVASVIEQDVYMSPSHYFFIRNISMVFSSLNYAREQIEKWYSIISEKKRVRIVQIHNYLRLDHYLLSHKPYLISWEKSCKDFPIIDLYEFYLEYYSEFDFCDLFRIYESYYPLLEEEKILFFVLISIPWKLDFNDQEIKLCEKITYFYDYLSIGDKFIHDYL